MNKAIKKALESYKPTSKDADSLARTIREQETKHRERTERAMPNMKDRLREYTI